MFGIRRYEFAASSFKKKNLLDPFAREMKAIDLLAAKKNILGLGVT